jgi:hypothetical protein
MREAACEHELLDAITMAAPAVGIAGYYNFHFDRHLCLRQAERNESHLRRAKRMRH